MGSRTPRILFAPDLFMSIVTSSRFKGPEYTTQSRRSDCADTGRSVLAPTRSWDGVFSRRGQGRGVGLRRRTAGFGPAPAQWRVSEVERNRRLGSLWAGALVSPRSWRRFSR